MTAWSYPAVQLAGRALTWERARAYALGLVALYLAAAVYFIGTGSPPLRRDGDPVGGDYIAFHTAGRMLLEGRGAHLYDPEAVRALQRETTGQRIPTLYDPYRNPPFFALLFAPLALLGLVPSFAVWAAISLALLAVALWLLLGTLPALQPRWRTIAVLVLAFTPVYLGLAGGNNSVLALLLYVLIYRAMLEGREREAGAWAALGLFKPQLFVVFPIIFVVTRRWRALGAYSLVAALLGLSSLALVGPEGIVGWVRIIASPELEGGIAAHHSQRMHGAKAFFDLLLPGHPALALGLGAAASALAIGVLVRAWMQAFGTEQPLPTLMALTAVVAVLANPHVFDYDLTVLVIAGLLAGPLVPGGRWWVLAAFLLLVARPTIPLGTGQLQPTVPYLAALVGWLYHTLRTAHAEARPAPTRPAASESSVRPRTVGGEA